MLAVLLGAALHASWNALVKSGSDPFLDTVLVATGVTAVAAMALPFMPLPDSGSWPFLIASALTHVGYYGLLVFAYRGGDLSLVYPIMRGSAPALTTLAAAVLLSERPSWGGWAGVLLVSGEVLLLAADSPRSKEFRLAPVLFALLLVAALRETSIIFSAILAVIFLKESISPLRYVSISIVSLGAIAIKSF